jgi:translation initiation factor 2 beta subunit (eIF-2beta)/eIF-5
MSVIQCPTCEDFIDTDLEEYDFEANECEKCIFMKGIER